MEEFYYLNQAEQERLEVFYDDEVMREAVKKVLLANIYQAGVLKKGESANDKNWAYNLGGLNDMVMDDEKVGHMLKITSKALGVVGDAFTRLSAFSKVETPGKVEGNPAE